MGRLEKIVARFKTAFDKFIYEVKSIIDKDDDIDNILKMSRLVCILALSVSLLTSFNVVRDLNSTSNNYQQVQQSIATIGQEYRTTLVVDGYKRAELHSIALRDRITKTIERTYSNNKEKLEEDLHSYISKNDINNTLYKIFSDEVFEYVDHWFQHRIDVRVIIADRRKILFSSATDEPFRTPSRVPELVFNYPHGEYLSCIGDDPDTLVSLTVSELVTDIDRLENLTLIAPSYIYEHKDLLGVGDVYPDGTLIDNDKLAVVVAFKPITTDHVTVIRHIQRELSNNKIKGYSTIFNEGLTTLGLWLLVTFISGGIWYAAELSKRKEGDDE